jgi:hypothetical protein
MRNEFSVSRPAVAAFVRASASEEASTMMALTHMLAYAAHGRGRDEDDESIRDYLERAEAAMMPLITPILRPRESCGSRLPRRKCARRNDGTKARTFSRLFNESGYNVCAGAARSPLSRPVGATTGARGRLRVRRRSSAAEFAISL